MEDMHRELKKLGTAMSPWDFMASHVSVSKNIMRRCFIEAPSGLVMYRFPNKAIPTRDEAKNFRDRNFPGCKVILWFADEDRSTRPVPAGEVYRKQAEGAGGVRLVL